VERGWRKYLEKIIIIITACSGCTKTDREATTEERENKMNTADDQGLLSYRCTDRRHKSTLQELPSLFPECVEVKPTEEWKREEKCVFFDVAGVGVLFPFCVYVCCWLLLAVVIWIVLGLFVCVEGTRRRKRKHKEHSKR
jgi:Flp pilus assembly protein TadB